MASIIITGETMEDVPEVKKMVDDILKGKITISRFVKFLNDNNLETKVRCIKENINPSVLDDFIGDTLSSIFSVPKKSENEDVEENNECEEVEDDERENSDKFWKKPNEEYVEHVKDVVDFSKRLIDDYGDSEEDDIDHTKAVKLFHSLMLLGRTYRQRAFKGDERYNITNFTTENILRFIESLDLPTDKIKMASERGKSNYYKMKIYKSFEEFERNMKDAYGIEDVWNPQKEVPEWFESVRNMQYRKFYPTEDILINESEWNEFEKWRKERVKEDLKSNFEIDKEKSFEDQCRHIINDIINKFYPIITGKALKYFEDNYKSNDKIFMDQLKTLYNAVESARNMWLTCFIDVDFENNEIICNPIQNTKNAIEKTLLNATSSKPDPKESSNKKSSTSKKIPVSSSAKNDKTTTKKKTTIKSSKTDTKAESNLFLKNYLEYILLNSFIEKDAKDLLFSYAINMDERFEELYKKLVDLKKKNKSVRLIKHLDEKTGKEDIDFVEE